MSSEEEQLYEFVAYLTYLTKKIHRFLIDNVINKISMNIDFHENEVMPLLKLCPLYAIII